MFAPFKSHSSESAGIQGDSTGKLVMESILETKAANFLQFIHGLRGSLHVTFEEGTCAAWLHDLGLNERLARVTVAYCCWLSLQPSLTDVSTLFWEAMAQS